MNIIKRLAVSGVCGLATAFVGLCLTWLFTTAMLWGGGQDIGHHPGRDALALMATMLGCAGALASAPATAFCAILAARSGWEAAS